MKRILKPLLITLAAILLLITIIIGYGLWFVFKPEKISPVINNQLSSFFNCEVNLGKVDLTFFSTFPNFELRVEDFSLINPTPFSNSDTLLSVERLTGKLNIREFRRNNEIILSGVSMTNGFINAHIDSLGNTNFDVLVLDDEQPQDTITEFGFNRIDLGNIDLKNINLTFADDSLKLFTSIRNMDAGIKGTITSDLIDGTITMKKATVSLAFNGDQYLDKALVDFTLPAQIHNFGQKVELKKATASLNGLAMEVSGTIETNPEVNNMKTQLEYRLEKWDLTTLLALVPPSFQSHLEGLEARGLISSSGTISGILTDSLMPLMDITLTMENGAVNYSDFHLPLSDINGDINVVTNLTDDNISYVNINSFKARTPGSSFNVQGVLRNILSDISYSLTTQANILLDEFQPMVPDTLPLAMKGRVQGTVNAGFRMSALEEMKLEEMVITGNVTTRNLDVTYDSLWVKTDQASMEFALPNTRATSPETAFASLNVTAGVFETGKLDSYYAAFARPALTVEMSDVRDTTRLPDIVSTFRMESLNGIMDTLSISLLNPEGRANISPREGTGFQPHILLAYNGDALQAIMGSDTIITGKIAADTDIIHDEEQEDIFLQWLVKGFLNMEEGYVKSSALTHSLSIPAVKMNFDPERFEIQESRLLIDDSDFNLSGLLVNVLSYFRGDSILRGDFNFVSDNTDLLMLMNLTSGLGIEEENQEKAPEITRSEQFTQDQVRPVNDTITQYTGPYMVPQGIDVSLNAMVKQASFGVDTATNINGKVRIYDGILLLDEVTFTTSAARMQLTAMYRTPRKNHLFLGLNYHMLDIEIERLLEMIPDIDTLMPMLRSFRGKGEFHMAVETYLDSLYNIKKSTLRGACSIRGQNLVLMDGETFSEIASRLRFSRRAENIVDSLSTEFTIFREEIDIYPFLIVMDRYKAIVEGRHNFDMSFNYHITLVESPLPVRLGLDIQGDLDDMGFRLASTRYPELYRPTARRAVESRQLELRRMIREALTERVIE